MRINALFIILIVMLSGCEKIGKRIEEYDMFGLEQAQEGIQQQEDKIRAARAYQRNFSADSSRTQNEPSILKGY